MIVVSRCFISGVLRRRAFCVLCAFSLGTLRALCGVGIRASTLSGISVRANHDGTSTNRLGVSKALTACDGQWHHLAVVFDQDAGLLKAYLDGVGSGDSGYENGWQLTYALESGNAFTPGTIFDTTQPLLLGHHGQTETGGNSYPTVGRFDDFAVWTRALTPAEILGIYNGTLVYPIPTPPTGIAGSGHGPTPRGATSPGSWPRSISTGASSRRYAT